MLSAPASRQLGPAAVFTAPAVGEYLRVSPYSASSLDGLRARIDAALDAFLGERRAAVPAASDLLHILRGVIAAGGKRLRPLFCYWGFRAAGGSDGDAIVRAAAALELLHTFAIVHDDIMDRSETRRGSPSVHAQHGLDVALLAGDLALVVADHAFMSSGFRPDELAASFQAYSRMRQEVIAGQYLDLAATPEITLAEAREIARLKSGRYTVVEPLGIGAALAGGEAPLVDRLCRFGEPLGEAFQLRDDILGVFGDPAVTGKPTDRDIREGKRNLLYAMTRTRLSADDAVAFVDRWGAADLSASEVDRLRDLVDRCGARAEVEARIAALSDEAMEELDRASLPPEPDEALRQLVAIALTRDT